jgi:outer membrane protein assembly factor BamB
MNQRYETRTRLRAALLAGTLLLHILSAYAAGGASETVVNPPVDAPTDKAPDPVDTLGLPHRVLLDTGLRNHGLVAQFIQGEVLFAVVGEGGRAYPARLATKRGVNAPPAHTFAGLVCFDATGRVRWREDFRHDSVCRSISPFPSFVDVSGQGDWCISCIPTLHKSGQPGEMRLYEPDGSLRWATPVPGTHPWGNGACLVEDLDGDGRREIVFGNCRETTCVDAETGGLRWSYGDGVSTCHGRMALGDLNGDGRAEICFGSEYADDEKARLSSLFILDGAGKVLHRRRNLLGDLGSTPVVLADVNGDGTAEMIVASQNLVWFKPRHPAVIYCVDGNLKDLYPPIETGAPRFVVGDFDHDDHVEAVGIQDYRDGGPLTERAVVCADLTAGTVKWKRPVPRIWLCGDPIAADVDGDGASEIIVTTNYPSGYAHQPELAPWGDLYILKATGEVLLRRTFPDAIMSPIVLDVDGDGLNELLLPCHDGKVYIVETPGRATSDSWPMPQAGMMRKGWMPAGRS